MKQENVHYQYIYLARISIQWTVVINIFVNNYNSYNAE